jgi:hypothetical protein
MTCVSEISIFESAQLYEGVDMISGPLVLPTAPARLYTRPRQLLVTIRKSIWRSFACFSAIHIHLGRSFLGLRSCCVRNLGVLLICQPNANELLSIVPTIFHEGYRPHVAMARLSAISLVHLLYGFRTMVVGKTTKVSR